MTKAETIPGTAAIAQRMVNAENDFADSIQRITGCSRAEAFAITALYLKNKIAKMDAVIGRISVKHGAFLDVSTLRNALEMVNA